MRKGTTMKKIASLFMAVAMVLSVSAMNVKAEGENATPNLPKTGTLTLQNKTDEEFKAKNSTFSVYQVLEAYATEGQDVYEYRYTKAFENFLTANSNYTVDAISKMSSGPNDYTINSGTVDKLAAALENYINQNTVAPTQDNIKVNTATTLEVGYYLVLETGMTEGYKTTKPILVAIPSGSVSATTSYNYNVTVTLKDQKIPTTKTIKESEDKKVESAAQQVGKEFEFEITQDVPKYDDTYNTIVFKLTDKMSKGLDFVNIVSVKADTTALTDGQYKFTKTENQDGTTTLVFDFSDLSKETGGIDYYDHVKNANKVYITYKAKLNKDATFGPTGNPNEVYPTFGNDPSKTTDGKKDITVNYAGHLQITKKGENGELLKGAEFTVYEDEECTTEAKLVTYEMGTDGTITTTPNAELSPKAITDKNGIVTFAGLGAGTYYIKETDAPGGYIKLEKPIKVTVTVDHPDSIVDGKETATYTYKVEGNGVDVDSATTEDGTALFKFDVNNTKGFTLPTTGGMGIYLFTIGGAILILAAVVLVIRSRKKEM